MARPLTDRAVRRRNYPVMGASGGDEIIEQCSVFLRGCCASVHPILNRRQWHVQAAGKLPDAQPLLAQPESQVQHGQILLQYYGLALNGPDATNERLGEGTWEHKSSRFKAGSRSDAR